MAKMFKVENGRLQFLPDGWTMQRDGDCDGWYIIYDETGAPVCEGETEEEAIEAAWEVYES